VLDIKRLQILLAIVEEGSVTSAAAALGYTPSAISQQLLRLEREAGQPLLDRHARGMTPTDAGLMLATHARKVLRQLAAAESDLADIAGVRRGSVTLGTFPTVGSSFLPLAVRRYRELFPNITLTISSGREDHLVRMLEEGKVAMSFLWDYEWQRVDNEDLVLTELFTDPTVLLVGSTHRLARRRTVRMADLAAEPWIIRAGGHPVVEVLQRSAVAAGFTPTIAFQANDYQEAQAMVSVGLGFWSHTDPAASGAPPSSLSTTSLWRPRPRTPESVVETTRRGPTCRLPAGLADRRVLQDSPEIVVPD